MKKEKNQFTTVRRNFMKTAAMGSAAGLLGFNGINANATPYEAPGYAKAMPPLKIKSVKAITTNPSGSNLIVVKVETTEP